MRTSPIIPELGGAFLITPIDEARGLRAIHGDELGFTYSRDVSGHSSGHYVLLRSWQPLPVVLEPGNGVTTRSRRPGSKKDRAPGSRGAPSGSRPPEEKNKVANKRRPLSLPRKKPAGKRGKSDYCHGWDGVACCFSGTAPGTPARQNKGTDHCFFCSAANLQGAMQSAAGRGSVTRAMKRFYGATDQHPEVFDLAVTVARLQLWVPEQADAMRVGAAKPKRTKPCRTRAELKKTKADSNVARWQACRARRKSAGPARRRGLEGLSLRRVGRPAVRQEAVLSGCPGFWRGAGCQGRQRLRLACGGLVRALGWAAALVSGRSSGPVSCLLFVAAAASSAG